MSAPDNDKNNENNADDGNAEYDQNNGDDAGNGGVDSDFAQRGKRKISHASELASKAMPTCQKLLNLKRPDQYVSIDGGTIVGEGG